MIISSCNPRYLDSFTSCDGFAYIVGVFSIAETHCPICIYCFFLQIFNLCVVVRTRSSYCLDLVVRCNAVCLIVLFLLTVFLIIFAYCPPSPPFPRISKQKAIEKVQHRGQRWTSPACPLLGAALSSEHVEQCFDREVVIATTAYV